MLKPMESAEMPLMILGWCSILYGIIELINALKIHSIRKAADRQFEEVENSYEEISSETLPGQPSSEEDLPQSI